MPLLTSHSAWRPDCRLTRVASRLDAALCIGGWPSSSILTSPGMTPPCVIKLHVVSTLSVGHVTTRMPPLSGRHQMGFMS